MSILWFLLSVATTAAEAQPVLRISRTTRIGAHDGPAALTQVRGVVIDDGRVYIGQPEDHAVKVFTRDGRLLRTIGRKGSGPGEFAQVTAFGVRGDTLWVSDNALFRISWFSRSTGTLLRTLDMREVGLRPGTLTHGGYVVESVGFDINADTGAIPVRYTQTASTSVHRSLLLPVGGYTLPVTHNGVTSRFVHGYADAPLLMVDGARDQLLVVDRRSSRTAGPAQFSVTRFTLQGDTVQSWRYTYEPVRLTPTILAERAGPRSPDMPRELAEAMRRAVGAHVRFLPPVSMGAVMNDGTLFLARERLGTTTDWWRIDSSGQVRGRVRLPRASHIAAGSSNHIWVVERDEFDVQFVVRYVIN